MAQAPWVAEACGPVGKKRRRSFDSKREAIEWGRTTARRVCGLPTFLVGHGKRWCLMLDADYAREIGWGRR